MSVCKNLVGDLPRRFVFTIKFYAGRYCAPNLSRLGHAMKSIWCINVTCTGAMLTSNYAAKHIVPMCQEVISNNNCFDDIIWSGKSSCGHHRKVYARASCPEYGSNHLPTLF